MRKTRKRPRLLKKFPAVVKEIAAKQACGKPIEIWWQDEARGRTEE
jgi:hypothetical protein